MHRYWQNECFIPTRKGDAVVTRRLCPCSIGSGECPNALLALPGRTNITEANCRGRPRTAVAISLSARKRWRLLVPNCELNQVPFSDSAAFWIAGSTLARRKGLSGKKRSTATEASTLFVGSKELSSTTRTIGMDFPRESIRDGPSVFLLATPRSLDRVIKNGPLRS